MSNLPFVGTGIAASAIVSGLLWASTPPISDCGAFGELTESLISGRRAGVPQATALSHMPSSGPLPHLVREVYAIDLDVPGEADRLIRLSCALL